MLVVGITQPAALITTKRGPISGDIGGDKGYPNHTTLGADTFSKQTFILDNVPRIGKIVDECEHLDFL